ncbi:MAG: rRNA (uracil1498-N3)-methyltransferase [Verrucomicrobiota bacterium]|jgi:16S rRNA (uracil1498-N3)-methyltransferase
MHRFYIPADNWNADALILRDSEAHHARDVLRLKPGDKAVLFNGRGREITAEVVNIERREVRLRKLVETETPPLRCRITLAQAIPKGKNMDLIVQKAVEIGASAIVPLISERTIVDLDAKEAAQKKEKWQQTAIEAAKQCGQNWLPEIETPQKLKDFFEDPDVAAVPPSRDHRNDVATGLRPVRTSHPPSQGYGQASSDVATGHDLRLIGSLQPDAQHLKKILSQYVIDHGDRPTSVLMLIGPEGDFTPAELGLARGHGCVPITLGPIILRVETAAIYCLSVLSYELFA